MTRYDYIFVNAIVTTIPLGAYALYQLPFLEALALLGMGTLLIVGVIELWFHRS